MVFGWLMVGVLGIIKQSCGECFIWCQHCYCICHYHGGSLIDRVVLTAWQLHAFLVVYKKGMEHPVSRCFDSCVCKMLAGCHHCKFHKG